jgi:hypothetical protein
MYGSDHTVSGDENRHAISGPYHQSDSGISCHQSVASSHADGVLEGSARFCCQRCDDPTVDLFTPANGTDLGPKVCHQPTHPFFRQRRRPRRAKAE